MTTIDPQSPDIAQGVDKAFETRIGERDDEIDDQGAGDQGMMFGYACDENDAMMPTPIHLAQRLAERLDEVRKAGILPYLSPDSKDQVTIEYRAGRLVSLDKVLNSTQHAPGHDAETVIKTDLQEQDRRPERPEGLADGQKIG